MHSKVHPAVALLVILIAIGAIGTWFWADNEAKSIGGPAGILVDPRGHLFIQMQNQLLEHDDQGKFLVRHDLAKLGVEQVIGSMAFFANGDILLRRGADDRALSGKLRAFLRLTNPSSTSAVNNNSGLYRCNLVTATCTQFGATAIDFKATFGVYIDTSDDTIYISDTTRHLLRKYSVDGSTLGKAVGGSKFPNQLLLHEGNLLVADTNHHRIRIVDPSDQSFGDDIASIDVVPPAARDRGQNWPSRFASVAYGWWVINMRRDMSDGGIYVFDDQWKFERRIDLPTNADPMAIVAFGDAVLITDWKNNLVYQVPTTGDAVRKFDSAGLQALVTESDTARARYRDYGYTGLGAFLLLFVLLLVRVSTGRE